MLASTQPSLVKQILGSQNYIEKCCQEAAHFFVMATEMDLDDMIKPSMDYLTIIMEMDKGVNYMNL